MTRTNKEVAAAFERESKLLAIQQANPYRIRAYRNAADTIRKLRRPLAKMVAEGRDLSELPTIGKDLAHQIEEILSTGNSQTLVATEQAVPPGLVELLEIPGLGPLRVHALNRSLGIESRDQLEQALREGTVGAVPGFGPGLEQMLLKNMALPQKDMPRMLLSEANAIVTPLLTFLESCPAVSRATVCGSFRRGKPTVGDLDVVLESKVPPTALQEAAEYEAISASLLEGPTRSTYRLKNGIQVDLRAVRASEAGAALVYFTGNRTHNIKLRRRAKRFGYKLNEYGLFDGDKKIACRSEQAVYSALKLQYLPPELRRGTDEIDKAQNSAIPPLVKSRQIKGDFHIVLPGGLEAQQMLLTGLQQSNFRFAGVVRPWHVHGHDPHRQAIQINKTFDLLDTLTGGIPGLRVFKGLKVILPPSGSVRIPDELIEKVDYLLAAVEDELQMPREQQTHRIVRAMAYPKMRILAHPLCRDLKRFSGLSLDFDKIFAAAIANDCWLEINGDPRRLDLPADYCRRAAEAGVGLCLGSGALTVDGCIERIGYASTVARRGWLGPSSVMNCRNPAAVATALQQRCPISTV